MEQTIDEKTTEIKTKPRNSSIASLLSLVLPGLGQVYNGQRTKGFVLFGLLLIIPYMFGLTRSTNSFYGIITLLIIEVVLRIYIIIDANINARRQKDYILKPYNTWYYHLIFAVGMVVIFILYDFKTQVGIQTYSVPSISNSPTFQVGDYIVSDTKAYYKKEPNYGDLVPFLSSDGQIFIFRIVGLPNDTLALINNVITINGKSSKTKYIRDTTIDSNKAVEFEEELPNGHKHLAYLFKQPLDSTKTNFKDIVVPSDNYFLLGDNRDYAADSRYEGFINRDRIKGQIIYSYWGKSSDRINIDFRSN